MVVASQCFVARAAALVLGSCPFAYKWKNVQQGVLREK